MNIMQKLKRFRLRAFDPIGSQGQSKRSVENVDGLSAARGHDYDSAGVGNFSAAFPPGYVKQDDGRPPH